MKNAKWYIIGALVCLALGFGACYLILAKPWSDTAAKLRAANAAAATANEQLTVNLADAQSGLFTARGRLEQLAASNQKLAGQLSAAQATVGRLTSIINGIASNAATDLGRAREITNLVDQCIAIVRGLQGGK